MCRYLVRLWKVPMQVPGEIPVQIPVEVPEGSAALRKKQSRSFQGVGVCFFVQED